MATKKEFFKNKALSLTNQKIALLKMYPDVDCYVYRDTLHWKGILCPSPLSKQYPVEIVYKLGKNPQVYVYDDKVYNMDTQNLPHHFGVDKDNGKISICLYINGEFTSRKWLCQTIVPWAVEWLFHYEIWQATGNWYGGGKHPNKGSRRKMDQFMEELDKTDNSKGRYLYNDANKAS